jgi:hypothetical protein
MVCKCISPVLGENVYVEFLESDQKGKEKEAREKGRTPPTLLDPH